MAEPGAEPGALGFEDTLDDEYDNSNIRTDINIIEATFITKSHNLPHENRFNAAPSLPFSDHPYPSLINLSNKFRQKGPNRIMYPPKNGPIAMIKKYGGNPLTDLPPYDPFDELTFEIENNMRSKYSHELRSLNAMQFQNELENIRALNRHGTLLGAQQEMSSTHNHKYPGIYIGDMVIRGPDWKWGNQDGGNTLKGTVRGIRQWHPNDNITHYTEVVVLWHHGLYGNYRFNYRGAYDVKVIKRLNLASIKMEPVCLGDTVCRKQVNWRWGNQDGGTINNQSSDGTIIELYASPAPFEGGARIAVCWDHQKNIWREKANGYKIWKENELKDNGGMFADLSLDEFEYNINVAEYKNNLDEQLDVKEDEKQLEEPGIELIEEEEEKVVLEDKNDKETIVSPSSTGKGACLKTVGVTTDDPWAMKDDYKQWDVNNTAEWVRMLNEDFDNYGDNIEDLELNGNNFNEFQLMSFWMNKIDVENEKHAKALAAAAKYRIEQFEIEKNKPKDDNNNEKKEESIFDIHKNDNDNSNDNNDIKEDVPPQAFIFDIPMMDDSLLDQMQYLKPPNENQQVSSGNESEGGGEGPGLTDDENQEEPIAAAAAAAAGPALAQVPIPEPAPVPAPGQDDDVGPGSVIIKDMKNQKKLYFWQKVLKKEAKLMQEFIKLRPKEEYCHITRYQYGQSKKQNNNNDIAYNYNDIKSDDNDGNDEDEYEWKEPDFDELLSKPIPKYRWGIQYNYDLQIEEKKHYDSNREYLMIDDRVKRGKDFTKDEKVGNYKSDFGIVLKIEQWDDTRLDNDEIRGDKIYLTWSSFRPFRFNYKGSYDIEFFKRGQVFALDYSHIRVGDRVCRGFSWSNDMYGNEDNGQGQQGTVVAVQYVLQVTGIIAKVRWHKNDHINLYSWGFKNVYDIRRVS